MNFASGNSGASVGQARFFAYPRSMDQGLEWWEARIRNIDAGSRAIDPGRLYPVSLDELVGGQRRRSYRLMRRFAGLRNEAPMLKYFIKRVHDRNANMERWRKSVPERRHDEIDRRYREILEGMREDGLHCAELLIRVYDERKAGIL